MSKSEKLHKEICLEQILFDFNFISALVTPPSFHHLRDEMPPPLSGEASLIYRLKSAFYQFEPIKYNKNTPINLRSQPLPPLKGEVSKIDNFNCQFLTEGSGIAYTCAVSRKIRNLLIYGIKLLTKLF
jgi:hypothetical protein